MILGKFLVSLMAFSDKKWTLTYQPKNKEDCDHSKNPWTFRST